MKINNILSRPQIPPIFFPDENSGYKIKHIANYYDNYRHDSSKDEPRLPMQLLQSDQEIANIETYQQTNSRHQEIPLLIKLISENLRRQVEKSNRKNIQF